MIEIRDLKKQYGSFMLDASLSVAPGMVTGLIGKNGAGKSTMIKALLGLIKIDGGSARILGRDAKELTPADRELIGVAFADAFFNEYFTIQDITRIMKKMYKSFDETHFNRQCQLMELPLNKKVNEFSTGMKAKLRVLTAMSHEAKVLILDEPTLGLDVEARMEILDMLRAYMMVDEERAILITSHISSDLSGICDDIYMLHQGKMILHEDTDVILSDYALIKAGDDAIDPADMALIIAKKREDYGYCYLTKQKQYFMENYKNLVIEKAQIDDLILMMTGGKRA